MSQRRSRAAVAEDDNEAGLEEAIKECARYIVCREGSKVPIKRAELLKHLASLQVSAGQFNTLLSEANKILKRVYGYKLVQVEAKSGIQFIVVLNEDSESVPSTATDPDQRRLLIAALTHIYMTGGPVVEDDMWRFLEEAGLLEQNDNAGKKTLTGLFTKQLYLSYYKLGEGELARPVFSWGQRAVEEMPKLMLLQKVADAFEKTPDYWYEQFKEATEEGGEEIVAE